MVIVHNSIIFRSLVSENLLFLTKYIKAYQIILNLAFTPLGIILERYGDADNMPNNLCLNFESLHFKDILCQNKTMIWDSVSFFYLENNVW